MKNFIHTTASVSFIIWGIGYLAYDVPNIFHLFLLVACIAAAIRLWAFKPSKTKKKRHMDINSSRVDDHTI
ncbi:hypothetical protein DQQ10_05585 [Pseudochryseolinea flava]|uniref:Lmo0937 family membrane protein n=1 Tax=Pseudochryseolinea flava TaxID=2059302 RepID=A0A364Y4V6_9BACT|nr:hypothetical protein DQQ10_05585 [Pseudochryseolinea flava]